MNFLKDVGTKAKGFVGGNRDKIDKGLAKAADLANKKTKGKHQDKIDKGLAKVSATLDKVDAGQRGGQTPPPAAPPQP